MLNTQQKGEIAENIALNFLKQEGLQLLDRNYLTKSGEIDLIMQDRDTVAFIEVRARSSIKSMHPVETIDTKKREHIIRTSLHYLQNQQGKLNNTYRFDVVILTGPVNSAKIEWIKNAFEA